MPSPVSRKRLWAGRTLSALAALFLLFDSVIKLMKIAPVVESSGPSMVSVTRVPLTGIPANA